MAAAAGMRAGDELLAVGGQRLEHMADIHTAVRAASGEPTLRMTFLRGETTITKEQPRIDLPAEVIEGGTVQYDEVQAASARLRTIVGRPEGIGAGPFPAVLLLQGISLASIDGWHDPSAPLCQLAQQWTGAGFVTMRLEKRGVGDSEGAPAAETDFETEVEGFRAALLALKSYPFVDPKQLFVFGHSVGGMIAPLLARQTALRGMMIYGSSAWPWQRCMLASLERQIHLSQHGLEGPPPTNPEAEMSLYRQLYQALFAGGLSPAQAFARNPALRACDDQLFGRSLRYLRQLDSSNVASAWRYVDCPVLVMKGDADWIVSDAEQLDIVGLVSPPGSTTLCTIKQADHLLRTHLSTLASFSNYGSGHFAQSVADESLSWMRAKID